MVILQKRRVINDEDINNPMTLFLALCLSIGVRLCAFPSVCVYRVSGDNRPLLLYHTLLSGKYKYKFMYTHTNTNAVKYKYQYNFKIYVCVEQVSGDNRWLLLYYMLLSVKYSWSKDTNTSRNTERNS